MILSPIEQSIKRKIEAVGTPLKDWDINIYRGVLTGYNEAFIISTERRNEILANCQTEDERRRTDELIRPILRGRDIKRYGYEWAELYLIATFPARHYDINQYPAVKQYLLSFAYEYLLQNGNAWVANNHLEEFCKQKLTQDGQYVVINGKHVIDDRGNKEKGRKKTSNKWFETQDSISYWEDFSKPKIVYNDIAQRLSFALCENGEYLNNTVYFMASHDRSMLHYLLRILNSELIDWYYRTISVQLGEKAVRMFSIYVLRIPVPKGIIKLDDEKAVCLLYGLSPDEQAFILHQQNR